MTREDNVAFGFFVLLMICAAVFLIAGVRQDAQEREAQQQTYCKAILERVPTAHDSLEVLHRFPECLP